MPVMSEFEATKAIRKLEAEKRHLLWSIPFLGEDTCKVIREVKVEFTE
jgi:hypothetical protein